jgi:heat shock protein HtpX
VLFLLANIPIAAYSRWREYRADKGAAKMVSPQAMISALRAIDVPAPAATQRVAEADMAMIHNKSKVSIHSTHPPIEDRIKALERMM